MPDDPATSDQTPPDQQQPGEQTQTPSDQQTANVSLTQEELNRRFTSERARARREGEKQIAEQLGVSIEDAKKIIEKQRQTEDAIKSEAQRDREEAQREKAEADRARAEAAADRRAAKIERKLGIAGISEEDLGVVSRMVVVEEDADDEAIQAAIDDLKNRPTLAGLFKQQGANGGAGAAPSSNPGGGTPRPGQTDDAFSRGFEKGREAVKPRSAAGASQ